MQVLTSLLPDLISEDTILAWNNVQDNYSEKIFTGEQQKEYEGFKNKGRKQEYLATRGLVKDMADYMGLEASDFFLQKDAYGKPMGQYGDHIYPISIAHTDDQVLCAISKNRELGVDMEPINRPAPERLRNRMLHPDEVDLVKNEETIRIWTIKEAIVKLEGKGMRRNLSECPITDIEENQFIAIFNDDCQAKICSFTYQNHWLAIAWNN